MILKIEALVHNFCEFYKIFLEKSPSYLFQLIPRNSNVYATSSESNTSPSFKIRHNFFKDSIFLAVMTDWDNLDINILILLMCFRTIEIY